MLLLRPLLINVLPVPKVFVSVIYFTLGISDIRFLPIYFVFDSKNPLESFVNPAVFCKGVIFLILSALSFLMFNFRLEPGLAFISGRNDYDDFIKESDDFMKDYVVFSMT